MTFRSILDPFCGKHDTESFFHFGILKNGLTRCETMGLGLGPFLGIIKRQLVISYLGSSKL